MEVKGSKPTGRTAPVPANRGPRRSDAFPPAEASWSQRDARETGVSSGSEHGVLPAADPGQEALGPTDGQSETVLDPLLGPRETNNHSSRGEGAAAHTHPGGGGSRSVSVQRRGARVSTTPPALGLPPPGRWDPRLGPRGVSRWREAVAARAHHQLRDQDGDAGSSASERRRAGGRDGERQRAAPAARGLQPREAPPTSRPSLPALRATPRPGARVPRRGGRAPASSRRLGHAGVAGMLGPSPRATPKGRGIGCGSFGGKSWAKSPGIYELSRARRFLFTPPLAQGQTQHRGPASRAFT